ncbi:MAG: urease accessory protein UreE [Deltaproteobacteria bacterium]
MLNLTEKCAATKAFDRTLTLSFERRQKSRQRVRLDDGGEAAIVLAPGLSLAEGDHLRASDGTIVRVHAGPEAVTVACAGDPLLLARACYHLGNRHVALQVGEGWVRYQPDHVLDAMVVGLGLAVTHENLPFEPEGGAYGGQRLGGNEGHNHAHGHG